MLSATRSPFHNIKRGIEYNDSDEYYSKYRLVYGFNVSNGLLGKPSNNEFKTTLVNPLFRRMKLNHLYKYGGYPDKSTIDEKSFDGAIYGYCFSKIYGLYEDYKCVTDDKIFTLDCKTISPDIKKYIDSAEFKHDIDIWYPDNKIGEEEIEPIFGAVLYGVYTTHYCGGDIMHGYLCESYDAQTDYITILPVLLNIIPLEVMENIKNYMFVVKELDEYPYDIEQLNEIVSTVNEKLECKQFSHNHINSSKYFIGMPLGSITPLEDLVDCTNIHDELTNLYKADESNKQKLRTLYSKLQTILYEYGLKITNKTPVITFVPYMCYCCT
jgi:hypothetical protein